MFLLIKIFYWVLFISVFIFLFYEIALFVFSSLLRKSSNQLTQILRRRKFIILIPAFREGKILISTIKALEKINYPKNLFTVVLLNDECDGDVIAHLQNQIKIINVKLTSHSKIESLSKAIDLIDNFDFVVILDADNLIHPDFLMELNNSIKEQTKIIQGIRLPKNLGSRIEKIDAMTDFVYNELDRIAPSNLGLSGTLSGSGFAISSDLFKQFIPKIKTTGGFDKILQSELMLQNIPIEICKNAIVFDEKTDSTKNYIRQRTRWLYYHFYNSIKYGLKLLLTGILHLNFNQIHFGLISLRPPINLLFVLSLILVVSSFWICPVCSLLLFSLLMIFTLVILNILRINKILSLGLVLSLPLIFINQLFSMFRLKEARESSLKTEHYHSKTIDEILQETKSVD